MMKKPVIGFLPLYVELYDLTTPEIRPSVDEFHEKAVKKLQEQGLKVIDAPVCRLELEFETAIKTFEKNQVDAIVTLHLAYSPSLESERVLSKVNVPIIIMDATPAYVYDQTTEEEALMLNHGIHGVQDMCNLLVRNGKIFRVLAGHMEYSDVVERVAQAAQAAMMVKALRQARVGLVGSAFHGMGDFQVDFTELERDLGIQVIPYNFEMGARRIKSITDTDIRAEYELDRKKFEISPQLTKEVYERSAQTCLAIRRWEQEEKLTAFTINFLETEGEKPGLPIMPFTECCKAMERGIGYAGEGDVLTAAFAGALLQGFAEVTFTEMFCPNWKEGSVFLSHMGEFNYRVADGRPVLQEKPFPFTSAKNPTVAYRTMKSGRAILANLAPFGQGRYQMTLAQGEMLKVEGVNTMENMVNGWFKPDIPLAAFLEQFSQDGGTHHSVLIYGDKLESLEYFADFLGIQRKVLN